MIDTSNLPLTSPNFEVLKQRALKSLLNPNEIDNEVLMLALQDSNEACKGRDVPNYVRLDFAYVRLKLYLKIDLNGEDELLFKNAMQIISNSPLMNECGELFGARFYTSETREESL